MRAMETENPTVRATVILTLTVTQKGQTVYLKVSKDLNASLGLRKGDAVEVAITRIVSRAGFKKVLRSDEKVPVKA